MTSLGMGRRGMPKLNFYIHWKIWSSLIKLVNIPIVNTQHLQPVLHIFHFYCLLVRYIYIYCIYIYVYIYMKHNCQISSPWPRWHLARLCTVRRDAFPRRPHRGSEHRSRGTYPWCVSHCTPWFTVFHSYQGFYVFCSWLGSDMGRRKNTWGIHVRYKLPNARAAFPSICISI